MILSQLNHRHDGLFQWSLTPLNHSIASRLPAEITMPTSVLFVCLHGSAKSLIAAQQLRRLAAARGIPIRAASAGVDPDAAVPPHVIAGLATEGIEVSAFRPEKVTDEMIANARYVVSIGCDLSPVGVAGGDSRRWDSVPAVSDGYAAARDAIVAHVESLLDEIVASPSPTP
jgi:arsenate reductase